MGERDQGMDLGGIGRGFGWAGWGGVLGGLGGGGVEPLSPGAIATSRNAFRYRTKAHVNTDQSSCSFAQVWAGWYFGGGGWRALPQGLDPARGRRDEIRKH